MIGDWLVHDQLWRSALAVVPVAVLVRPEDLDRGHVADVVRQLRELRERTKRRPGSIRGLRDEGRRR